MACFIVPATEAVVSTIVTKAVEKQEKKQKKEFVTGSLAHKMKWLNNMLWGGSALLAFEHVWHGEIVPYFPFLTAAENKHDLVQMLHEMGTTGVCMALLVTVVWIGMVVVTTVMEKHTQTVKPAEAKEKVMEDIR